MSRYRDVFGVPIGAGDYILSSATQGGSVKIGTADPRERSLMMHIDRQAPNYPWTAHRKTDAAGSHVVVLRKANGSVPRHFRGVVIDTSAPNFDDLPGMWDSSDLIGGETDV